MYILKRNWKKISVGILLISCIFCSEFVIETKSDGETNDDFTINSHKLTEMELLELKELYGTYDENETYNMNFGGYTTGIVPPTNKEWDFFSKNTMMVDNITMGNKSLPASYDISEQEEYFPPIGKQINGSCVTWALVYYIMTYQIARKFNWDISGHHFYIQ
jgi:hypothetical protein